MRNSFVVHGDAVHIDLKSKRHGLRTAIVDLDALPAVKRARSWSVQADGSRLYAVGYFGRVAGETSSRLLQRHVMAAPHAMRVEFENSNTLDCRRANLRVIAPTSIAPGHCATKGRTTYRPNAAWIPRIASILEIARALDCTLIAPADLAHILQCSPATALRTAHDLGAVKIAGRVFVDRLQAIQTLQEIAEGGAYIRHKARAQRITDEIRRTAGLLRAKAIAPIAPTPEQVATITDTIHLSATELRITHTGGENLLQQLMALAMRWARDPAQLFAAFPELCHDAAQRNA